MTNLLTLDTEMRNENSMDFDNISTEDMLNTINQEDMKIAEKVRDVIPDVKSAVEAVCHALKHGGRLFYVGAGTSGRLGILDASECPPTFSTPPDLIQAIIAGGTNAFVDASESSEDNPEHGKKDLQERGLTEADVVMGIAASGRTPYVIGALEYARETGARAISLSSNQDAVISSYADIPIEVLTGPEVLSGSTRMKAATAHKMILNMITTTSMSQIGKVYENLMVDVKVSNQKLKQRATNIISAVTGGSKEKSAAYLESAGNEVKPAIVMIKANVSYEDAKDHIHTADGFVREAVKLASR